jgi:hypothetical protein
MPFPIRLSDAAIQELGGELDAIRDEVMDSRGERRQGRGIVSGAEGSRTPDL